MALVLAVVLFLFSGALLRSHVGRAFRSIRDSETAAVANGVNLTFYKTLAFAISAFYAGLAGSLYTINTAYISPDSFDVGFSLALVVGAVIGGLGTGIGPILGSGFPLWSPRYTPLLLNAKPAIP